MEPDNILQLYKKDDILYLSSDATEEMESF